MAEVGNLYGRGQSRRRHPREATAGSLPSGGARPQPDRKRFSGGETAHEAPALKLHLIDSMEGARTIWRSFERRAIASPFQTYTWLSAWFDNVGAPSGVSPVIVFGYDQSERLALLMPLGVSSSKGIRTLSWLGDGLAGYHAPLIDAGVLGGITPNAVEIIWNSVIAHLGNIDVLRLRRQPSMLGQLSNPFAVGGKSGGAAGGRILILPPTWPDFIEQHAGEGIQTGGDYARQLRQRGRLAIGLGLPSQARSRVIEKILVAARSRSMRRGRANPLLQEGVGAFLKTLALSESAGFFSVSAVNVDDDMVAASVGYVHGDRYYLAMTSLEESSDGRAADCLLFEELIRSCIVQGIRSIDFLGGTAAVPQWTREPARLYDTVAGQSSLGHLAVGMEATKRALGLGRGDGELAASARLTFTARA